GELLLYGDAVAHIAIARRLFDSLTPGWRQLGTVWLPLPHLLLAPLVAPLAAWRNGAIASLPAMIAYVASAAGVFRLVRRALADLPFARRAAWLATAIFALNPNLLYLQATAMTEPLYLAFFVWALVYLLDSTGAPP